MFDVSGKCVKRKPGELRSGVLGRVKNSPPAKARGRRRERKGGPEARDKRPEPSVRFEALRRIHACQNLLPKAKGTVYLMVVYRQKKTLKGKIRNGPFRERVPELKKEEESIDRVDLDPDA